MATGKRYYWIKLKDSFITSDTVDFLMGQKDGANYIVLYEMLCLKTINTGGRLSTTIGEVVIPYDVEKIQRDCKWFSIDTVRMALMLYKRLGMVYEDQDGVLVLSNHAEMVGSETDWAKQKREKKAIAERGNSVESSVENFHTEIEIRDKRSEIRDQRVENRDKRLEDNITYCGELLASEPSPHDEIVSKPSAPQEPSGFDIPLADGSTYNVPVQDIKTYKQLYPGVDVEQQLRNMIGWSMTAGNRRKTRRGIKTFINSWLRRDQDRPKGGRICGTNQQQPLDGYKPVFNGEVIL